MSRYSENLKSILLAILYYSKGNKIYLPLDENLYFINKYI